MEMAQVRVHWWFCGIADVEHLASAATALVS